MKRFAASVATAVVALVFSAGSAFAAAGGAPGAHGVEGRTWGQLVSGLAKSAPGAMGDHAAGK